MTKYYLAIDIGASSGRHVLGSLNNGRIQMEEVYRFENGLIKKNGHLCWDIDQLFEEIKNGLKECKRIGKIPMSLGIDTWGVDFVLLDKEDRILGETIAYRDNRTKGMDKKVADIISQEELYQRTGIQKQIFNTIYQLMAVKQDTPENMKQAACFLMIPDYLNYLLTGKKMSEYTNATTTQLVNAESKNWDEELMTLLGIKKEMFLPLSMPKTTVGLFSEEMEKEIGFTCTVVLPATHDTGSAVLAVPAREEDFIYISSGTWSLMGIESAAANCTINSMEHNFTNEGGYDYRYR
ncbi:MAG: FGGY family carbohydrate kinase, partial [Mobilitalea sp.]